MTIQGNMFSRDLWTYDLETGKRRRLTQEAGQNHSPLWSEDGRWVTFASNRDGPQRIYRVTVGARNTIETLLFGDGRTPGSWSPADRDLFFHERQQDRGRDIWIWTRQSGEGRILLGTNANERTPAISPNGRWLAYVSDAKDGDQVYLRPHPGETSTRVSPAGGVEPVWSRDGSELFFRSGPGLFSVAVDPKTGESSSSRRQFSGVFVTDPGGNVPAYDVSIDGTRFLMLRPDTRARSLFVVDHWQSSVFTGDQPSETEP
jgi:Tol biopolymer transport system component